MYDEPPDPEPNPCPYCEQELGYSDDCDHCKLATKLGTTDSALSALKHRLHCRARNLAWLTGGTEVAARRAEGVALLLELSGLPMPADYMTQARAAMTSEYGESAPYEAGGPGQLGHNVSDADIVERFMGWAHSEALAASPATFSGEVLSAKPATRADQLWWGDDANGVPRIFTQAEKRQGRGGGAGSTQWGLTLRETIEKALDSEARGAAFWLEFQREYLLPPQNLTPPNDPRYVRGGDQPKVSFVIGANAYTAYVGRHKSKDYSNRGLGFGGAEFVVKMEDGREFFTDNNWSRGEVPPHLRKLLKPNAVFLRGEAATKAVADIAA